MTERLFSTYQIAKLLGTTLGAVNRHMEEGVLRFRRMPDGTTRVTESELIDFLTRQGMDLDKVLSKAGYTKVSLDKKISDVKSQSEPDETVDEPAPGPITKTTVKAPESSPRAAQVCDAIFSDAKNHRAETIHFTPYRSGLVLQLRIDGQLRNKPNFSRNLPEPLRREIVAHLLGLADPSIEPDKLRVPIYSEFALTIDSQKMWVRLSGVPTAFGVKLVIRMPRQSADLARLEIDSDTQADLELLLESGGLIVVAASQKTARDEALAALLEACDASNASVLAIGPQLETDIYTVSHLKLNPPAGLTYAAASAAIADQDADTILLTELRDPTTAWGAFNAAHDGALVIAGSNCDSAREAISELVAMGIEPWPLGRTLKAVVQRASIPVLCEHCRRREDESSYQPVGCDRCDDTGWSGMKVLTGIVFVQGRLVDLIRSGAPSEQIDREIAESQPHCLANIAKNAIDLGVTTRDEAAGLI